MNEKQFLKEINSNKYKPHECVYFPVRNLLNDEEVKGYMIAHEKSFFGRFLDKFSRKKTAEQIIIDNFDAILNKWSCYGLNSQIIKSLLIRPATRREGLQKNFLQILEIIRRDTEISENNEKIGFLYDINYLIKDFFSVGEESKKFIFDNVKSIISHTSTQRLFEVVQLLKGRSPEIDGFLNELLEKNKIDITQGLILDSIQYRDYDTCEKQKEQCAKDYALTVSIMIDELLKSEDKRWIDINEKGGGSFSDVFEIGEKILKLGEPRNTYKIPYHRRILQPLVRTNLQIKGNNVVCVEICEKVDRMLDCNEQETIYQIYKELREDGIFWTDPKIENIGRLRRDNVVDLDGEILDVDSAAVGFKGKKTGEALKAGDFVILDTDYIYNEGDYAMFWGNDYIGPDLERRYQQEKQEEIAKKYNEQQSNANDIKEKDEQQQL